MPYQKIMVAIEGKEEEKPLIDEAMRVSEALGATLTVFHVNDPGAGKAHMMMDSLPLIEESDCRDLLVKCGHEEAAKKVDVLIATGEAYPEEIAKASDGFDLLVIGHRAKNQFLAFFTDSTDERVADLVSCPVLAVPLKG